MNLDAQRNAERWEEGCRSDPTRNAFLVPNLIRLLGVANPARILDIGAGTGYVPRQVDAGLNFRCNWTLIDIDAARLQIAWREKPPSMQMEIIEEDVVTYEFGRPFEAVLATFTLLEISEIDGLIVRLPNLVSCSGLLVVCLPDVWRDVIEHGSDRPKAITEFLVGSTSIPKIDKFTMDQYPFKAVRIEHLISRVLATGFELIELTESSDRSDRVYLLAFKRRSVSS